MYRRVFTITTVINSVTKASKVEFTKLAEADLVYNNENYVPCLRETLHYHPYGVFFFYYWKAQSIFIVDRGFTSSTGDACTVSQIPTAVTISTRAVTSRTYFTPPAFYGGFTYIAMDHSGGYSQVLKWTVSMDAGGTLSDSGLSSIYTTSAGQYIREMYAMLDVGLFFTFSGTNGYRLLKVDAATGAFVSVTAFETGKAWNIFQARFNNLADLRPVYVSPSDAPGTFYKATNLLTLHFTTNGTQYDFHQWPTDFGRYYAMQLRPGKCSQEGGSEDYNYIHINMLSLNNKAHDYCIDDSDDIYCGNSKWEEYNLEGCDDGDNDNGDGCSSVCLVETRWTCVNTVNATSVCTYVACGNSYLDAGEQCDDGNTANNDGCSSTCQVENCWLCTGGSNGTCTQSCENGIKATTYWNGVLTTEV